MNHKKKLLATTAAGRRARQELTPPRADSQRFISQDDAAARWGVSVDTIRRLISAGKVTGYRLNNRIIRVDVAEVDAAFRPIPVGGASR